MATVDIEKLQLSVEARLESQSFFSDVTVVSLRKLLASSQIDASLTLGPKATKIGTGVIVGMPRVECDSPNVPGPEIEVVVPILCIENPLLAQNTTNGCLKSAEQAAINVLFALHQWADHGVCALYADKRAILPVTNNEEMNLDGHVVYEVNLRGRLPQSQSAFCGTPTLAQVGGDVELTNVTSGASIYYTTDGTFPWSGNATAILYDGNNIPDFLGTIRWAAYKTGLLGSDVGQATIT